MKKLEHSNCRAEPPSHLLRHREEHLNVSDSVWLVESYPILQAPPPAATGAQMTLHEADAPPP